MILRAWWAGWLSALALSAAAAAQVCLPATRSSMWDLTAAPPTQSGVYADARFGVRGSLAYFVGYDAVAGSRGVWQTDGTPGGTQRYSPLGLGFNSTTTSVYATSDGVYLLTSAQLRRVTPTSILLVDNAYARTAGTSTELFMTLQDRLIYASGGGLGVFGVGSDGAGGFVREQLAPVPNFNGFPSVVSNMVEFGGRVYFAVSRQVSPFESTLYSTDGTLAGTEVVSSSTVGLPIGIIEQLTVFNGRLYFCGWTPTLGAELYFTDGTPAGTALFNDINVGAGSSSPQILGAAGDKLYVWVYADSFGNQPLLYTTGTPGPLTRVGDFLAAGVTDEWPSRILDIGGKAVFLGSPAFNSTTGREMYITDGTAVGTINLADINPGVGGLNTQTVAPSAVRTADGTRAVFLAAITDSSTVSLWGTDGTPAGTTQLIDAPNLGYANFSFGQWFLRSNGLKAFFPRTTISEGREPWISDGTLAGTTLLRDVNPSLGTSSAPGPPAFLPSGQALFAAAEGQTGYEVWGSDGTTPGTSRVSAIGTGSLGTSAFWVSSLGNRGLYVANSPTSGLGTRVYSWGGSGAGTLVQPSPALTVVGVSASIATPQGTYLISGSRLVLATSGPENLTQLNTVGAFTPASSGNYPFGPMARLGSGVVFSGSLGATGVEPAISGPTPNSGVILKDLRIGGNSWPQGFTPLNGGVLFFADAGAGHEPHFTDGSSAGTISLGDVNPGVLGCWPVSNDNQGITRDLPAVYNGRAYFVAQVAGTVRMVSTDGTLAGTSVLTLPATPRASLIAATTQGVYFVGFDPATPTDIELYVTNGTPAGTRRVIDLNPGAGATSFQMLFGAGGKLYFGASISGSNGLYVAQGSPEVVTPLPFPIAGEPVTTIAPGGLYAGRFVYLVQSAARWRVLETRGTPASTCVLSDPVSPMFFNDITSASRPTLVIAGSRGFYFGADTFNLGEPRAVNLCPADINNSGTLTIQDVFDFLTAFFGGDSAADFNGAGGVTVQDVFDFVAAWFAGCA